MGPRFKVHQYYPYRTARVVERFMTLPRELTKELENRCAEDSGVRIPDNHVCYKLECDFSNIVYVMFTDFYSIFGRSIQEGDW